MTRPRLRTTLSVASAFVLVVVASLAPMRALPAAVPPEQKSQVGRAFRVPYRLTETNHFLVRVRINGKGPFNFLVDSGAPALFISTETAKKISLVPPRNKFWTPVDRLEIEGGARLSGVKARVEDPFQLVGMNALGLPGASIDGILGFTILARFRLQIDPTDNRMTWTLLDYQPSDPPVPDHRADGNGDAPVEMQLMNAMGPVAKGLAFLMGKQPEEALHPRGYLGVEWAEKTEAGRSSVTVSRVLAGSPAAKAGIREQDRILDIGGKAVTTLEEARAALALVRPDDAVTIGIGRGPANDVKKLLLELTAGEGL
jgi:serine protease Do